MMSYPFSTSIRSRITFRVSSAFITGSSIFASLVPFTYASVASSLSSRFRFVDGVMDVSSVSARIVGLKIPFLEAIATFDNSCRSERPKLQSRLCRESRCWLRSRDDRDQG